MARLRYLIVAEGGGTNTDAVTGRGGGGGGQVLDDFATDIIQAAYFVEVGVTLVAGDSGNNGKSSRFNGVEAVGGGTGGGNGNPAGASEGGAGGGEGAIDGVLFQVGGIGNEDGGNGGQGGAFGDDNYGGGGGGGGTNEAGQNGANFASGGKGGDGGDGKQSNISGTTKYYGGGGGGSGGGVAVSGLLGGEGGLGGGGDGFDSYANINGQVRVRRYPEPNTGGGRGGNTTAPAGSGIVILAYATDGSDGISPESTGGIKTEVGGKTIHTFLSSNLFNCVLVNQSNFLAFM